MDALLLQRQLGLGRGPGAPSRIWGGPASESLVRKLELEWSVEQQDASVCNDVSWDCSGSYLASAGDDCSLSVRSRSGRLLWRCDPVRARAAPRRTLRAVLAHLARRLVLRAPWLPRSKPLQQACMSATARGRDPHGAVALEAAPHMRAHAVACILCGPIG